ncbi:glycosyl transferase [Aeromonas hydrophila]|uniref:glycosyltransferase n=1 Tax=Aeromonas TaxID=642 RepID=UPI00097D9640|nr:MULTISPECIES: glycosyltransferase [Aeromonas]MDX7672394.1 glycosyltransferase [Aeromonas caviae]MDX7866301.1 glycosyltransferase [Aeromonas caviae]ONG01418.1 glycosyl transferase [Aeromonas hydrophila]
MKIMMIITGLGMGGAERQVCDLVDCLSKLGHQVLLVSLTGSSVNRPQSIAVKLVELEMAKSPFGFIKAYQSTRRLINEFKPDVVHSHMVHANIFARLLRLTTDIPRLVCTAHNTNEGGRGRILAYRLTDRLCDISTNVSQEAVDAFVQQGAVPAGRMVAIHNGIDTDHFRFSSVSRIRLHAELGLAEDVPLLLAVGRLNVQKDYPNLLTAFSALPSSYELARLAIIGAGEEEESLKARVIQLGLSNRVHFLGLRRDVNEWMSAADVFVLSSAWEGFGLVVAEAMACERVVVATDCGGVKEVVGDAGFLVPPRDSQLLADALVKALSLPMAEKDKLTKLARSRVVGRYSIDSVCKKWLSIYQGK